MKNIITAALVLIAFTINAQQDYTLYHMRYVPQASNTNAAFTPESKITIGIPGLSGNYFNIQNNGFKYSDLITLETDNGGALRLDVPNALGKMRPLNLLSEEIRIDFLNFGFKAGENNYLQFNITSVQKFSLAYTRDLFALLFVGNGLTPDESMAMYGSENYGFLGGTADLTGSGINVTSYQEIGLRYARTLMDDKLTIGIRPKLLLGSVNIQTRRSDFTISTDANNYAISTTGGLELNTNLPAVPEGDSLTPQQLLTSFGGNIGFGLDLGVQYKLTKKFELSAAVHDLGFITWNSNPVNYVDDDFTFEFKGVTGIENGLLADQNATSQQAQDSLTSSLQQIADTLISVFTPTQNTNPYSTGIGARINIGARYAFTKRHSVAAMASGRFVGSQFKPGISLAYNFRLYKWLGLTAAYNAYNNSYSNIGAGLSFNIFPVQFHFITDNLWALSPATTKSVHARFGINLVFGHDKKEIKEDRNF